MEGGGRIGGGWRRELQLDEMGGGGGGGVGGEGDEVEGGGGYQ